MIYAVSQTARAKVSVWSQSIRAHGHQRTHSRCTPGGNPAGADRDGREDEADGSEGDRVERIDLEEHRTHPSRRGDRAKTSKGDPNQRERRSLSNHEKEHVTRQRAEGNAKA